MNGRSGDRAVADTPADVESRLVDAWRRMTDLEIVDQINGAWRAGQQLAWFSLKDRFPAASDDELRIRLAAERFGWDLAVRIHPGAAFLQYR